jgi:FtsP/CotA-like multicopper oxidase with cupredoxin domain
VLFSAVPTRRRFCSTLGALLLPGVAKAQMPGQEVQAHSQPVLWEAASLERQFSGKINGQEPRDSQLLWVLNGQSPGPVLRLGWGKPLHLAIKNSLEMPLAFHCQGLRAPNSFDGVAGLTQKPILPGETGILNFIPPDSGTFLLRPMILGQTSPLQERGLSAILIVEENRPPIVDDEQVLLIDDLKLEENGVFSSFAPGLERMTMGRLGNVMIVNGMPVPLIREVRPGARLRLRLVNAANARSFRLRFDGLRPFVAAVDSQPIDTFEPLRASLPFSPGTRYDILLDMPREEGATGTLTGLLGDGLPLVTLRVKGQPVPVRPDIDRSTALEENPRLPANIRLQDALRRDLVIEGGARPEGSSNPASMKDTARIWTLNKESGTFEKPLFSIKRGRPVVLSLTNATAFPQVFHIHGHALRLLHGLDDGWEPYWLDTVQIPEGRTSRIAFLADNPGKWLIGSSILERLDAGLWTWFEVT